MATATPSAALMPAEPVFSNQYGAACVSRTCRGLQHSPVAAWLRRWLWGRGDAQSSSACRDVDTVLLKRSEGHDLEDQLG